MGPWEVKSSESVSGFGFRVSGFGFRSSKPTLTVGFGFRVSGFAGRNQLCRPLSGSRLDVPVGTARVGKSSTTAFSSASGPHRTTIAHRSKRKKKKSWNFGSRQTISCNKPKSATGVRRRPRPPRDERKRRKQGKERLPKSQRLTRQRQRRRRRLLKAAAARRRLPRGAAQAAPPPAPPLRVRPRQRTSQIATRTQARLKRHAKLSTGAPSRPPFLCWRVRELTRLGGQAPRPGP